MLGRRFVAAGAAVLLAVGALSPGVAQALPDPDPEDITAVLDVSKTASPATAGPGDSVVFTIAIGCSAISDVGCRGAITTDAVPEPFVIDSVTPGGPNSADDPEIDGQDVTVTWTQGLGGGAIGMLDNTTSQITIVAHVPEDVPYDYDGQTITNTAIAEGTNAADDPASAEVTINVPLELDTTAGKTFEPASALAAAGTDVTADLTGTNDSNATVDSLVIQDPPDPDATPNPFTYLGFAGFGDVSPPEGATSTTYEVYVDGAWVECPDGQLPDDVDPADVRGTRVTFEGAIPPDAEASVDLDLQTTAAAVTDDTTVTNDVESEVALDDESASDDASADFVIQANAIDVDAGKTFDPDIVVAGDSSTVTLDAANNSAIPIDSLTITEPSSGSFPDDYAFGGFTGPIAFPDGATSATVTYQPSGEQVTFADGETPDPPADGAASVTSFSIEFEGDIDAGATTSVPFDVVTDPEATGLPNTVTNEVAVEGENDGATDDDTASDDLYVYDEVIEPYIDKSIYPSQILANPGEVVTVALEGGTTEVPDPPDQPDGTTGDAEQIVIQDPLEPLVGNPWWNAFDLESIVQTPVPADAELTVYYYDTTDRTWKVLTGPVAGPTVFSYDVPDDISAVAGGIRFQYDYTGDGDGFPPGTDLAPRFTSSLRDTGRWDEAAPPYNTDPDLPNTLVPNCAQSSASNADNGTSGEAEMDPDAAAGEEGACPDIEIIPTDGEGAGDLVDKAFGTSSSGGDASVIARSGDTIPSTLGWSTGGYSGFETVDITDVADPEATGIEDSVFDAFDLTRVEAISASDDPFLTYDRIASVQLWDGSSWSDADQDPCPAACDGTFPGLDLTDAEQESTLAVRLVFEESPNRAARAGSDPAAPPVGSGVARSFGNTRHVTLTWQVRDEKRSDGSPVLEEETYNLAPDTGIVRNRVNATGHPADGSADISSDDQDDVTILDVPITTTTTKDWLGGPLAIPAAGTPASQYPLSRIRVTTKNTTPARVDQLAILEPAPGSTTTQDPFDYVDVVRIAGITVPSGATETRVVLECADGTTQPTGDPGYYTRAEALALTTMPCDVTGVGVLFNGRIASAGTGVLALDVRLRATQRTTGAAITTADSPITNSAQGIVADVDAIQDCPPPADARFACADDPATIDIVNPTFGIVAGKSIEPASQFEGDDSPVTVTVSAQNTGSARPFVDQITDDDASFWNAFDFEQMDPAWVLPQPVEHVRACYLSGGTFSATTVEADDVGGSWTCQELPPGPPFADDELTLDQAREFIDTAAETVDIHGVRFGFLAGSQEGWQSPADPLIEVPFDVVRRDDLRSGGPVPTTRSDQTAAPGEDDPGVFVDTVDVAGESVLIGADNRLTATDSADDDYTYEHLTVGVDVSKTPTGQVAPGTVIPYSLTFTNTGDAPLTNPVFTDELPSDADGPMLIFDPDSDPAVNSPYAFELEGDAPDPPNGDPLPTDQDDITITETGDEITFAMPPGTVLEPGQTYTITIDLMLRPGLTPDDQITNTATIRADEPFDPDACTETFDAATGRCEGDTVVSPVRVAALSTVKKVKADVPVEESGIPEIWLDRSVIPPGIEVPDDYCDTAADAGGFYRAPCVPVTYPGDTETWKFTITNVGTLPLDEVVSIDVFPHVGDTGIIVPAARNSEWTPTFADQLQVISDNPAIDTQIFYADTYDVCTDDLSPLVGACEPGAWQPYDPATVPDADVKALKTVMNFPTDSLFQPGEVVEFEAKTRTTPTDRTDSELAVAWNTAATGGVSNDNGTRATITPTEGRKVGVTYPTGPIQLQKVVEGDGQRFAPDEFTVQPECTIDGEPVGGLDPVVLEANGDPVQIDGLPWGAECTASETDQGQTSQEFGTATVGGPDDEIGLVTVTNRFDVAGMQVTKSVDSDAVDQDGNAITYGPFVVQVDCTFLGDRVFGAGYSLLNPMRREIADGETWAIFGLPIGAECTTSEPDDADAAEVTISPNPVTIGGPDGTAGDVRAVTVDNRFGSGSLHLRKLVLPAAVEQYPISEGPFTLHVTCTLTDASHPDGTVVYDDDVVLQGPQPLETTIDGIATGAVCDVTEPDPGAATSHRITPGTVTIGDGTTVDVRAENFFGAGVLTVTKRIEGDGADLYGAGPFEVSLACTYENAQGEQVPLATAGGATRTLSEDNAYTATFSPLLFGSTCRIEETRTAGATTSVITDADGNEVSEFTVDSLIAALQLDVTNTFDTGSIVVRKQVRGEGPDRFEVGLSCVRDVDGTRTGVDIPGGAARELTRSADFTATYEDLPTGAECQLRETDDGGADEVAITPNDGDPAVGTATVGDGAPVTLSVVNTFVAPATDDAGDGSGEGPSELSDAGGPRWVLPMLAVGLAALAAGLGLLRGSRRRRT